MYAIVKTGGKQYKVAPGDILSIEKLDAEPGAKVELEAICIVDGKNVEADPAKAAATKVTAIVLDQFRGDKQLVFRFKKRKNYKKMRGHRQYLTRVQIEAVGSAKAEKKAAKPAAKKEAADAEAKAAAKAEPKAAKPAAKKAAAKPAAEKKEAAEKKPAAKKAAKPAEAKAEKKPAAKEAEAASTDAE